MSPVKIWDGKNGRVVPDTSTEKNLHVSIEPFQEGVVMAFDRHNDVEVGDFIYVREP